MNIPQTHSRIKALAALLTAVTLYACNGEDAKTGAKEAAPAKVTETQTAPAPTLPESNSSSPAAITQAAPPAPAPVTPPAEPAVVPSSDKSGLINIARGKAASQSGNYSENSKASLAVDGNVDGNYAHGSVSVTSNSTPHAWLDIDLGTKESIDHIVVWNRTDGFSDRLANYWIFVSDKPFSSTDTVEKLKKSNGIKAIKGGEAKPSFTTSGVGRGRYVRIQLDGSAAPDAAYLQLAEVEVYRAK